MNAWKEARNHGLGGSDIATLLGYSRWKGPLQLWAEKVGKIPDTDLSDVERVEWGNRLEGPVIEAYWEKTERLPDILPARIDSHAAVQNLDDNGTQRLFLKSKEWPWLVATPDGFIDGYGPLPWGDHVDRMFQGPGVLEIKTTSAFNKEAWSEGVPDYYVAQAQHYLLVTGLLWASFGVLIGGQELRIFDIGRDLDMHERIVQVSEKFMKQHVYTKKPPEPSHLDAESHTIQQMFPDATGSIIELSDKAQGMELMLNDIEVELKTRKIDMKQLENRKAEIRNGFRMMIGENSGGIIPGSGSLVTYKPTTRKGYTVVSKTFRTLRIKKGTKSG